MFIISILESTNFGSDIWNIEYTLISLTNLDI